MFIEIERLTPEPLHIQHLYACGEIGFEHDDASLQEPVATDFILTHKGKDLRVEGTIQTAIRFQCSRCLTEYTSPLKTRFDLCYLPQSDWKPDEEIELKYEDMDIAYYDGVALDVDLLVLEQIELMMPMKLVCREDCRGLCPSCGADLNQGACPCKSDSVDSRLAVLRDFRNKMK